MSVYRTIGPLVYICKKQVCLMPHSYHDINKHRFLAIFQNQSKSSDSLGKIHEHIHKVYHQNVPYVTTDIRILGQIVLWAICKSEAEWKTDRSEACQRRKEYKAGIMPNCHVLQRLAYFLEIQTVKTIIRLLQEEQFDLSLH